MAKQRGVIKLNGTLDDITFSKTRNGFRAGMKSSLTKNRLLTDSAFARTRENMSEFGRAGSAGKVLRKALRSAVQQCKDVDLTSRMLKSMMVVIKADAVSTRGLRNVIDGETELLKGFEFNAKARLEGSFFAPFVATVDRVSGNTSVNIPSFVPVQQMIWPEGATHFKIMSAAAAVDFTTEAFDSNFSDTAVMPIDSTATAVINQVNALPAASTHPLFLALGMQFFQQVNGVDYPLKNGAHNSLSLVEVVGI